MCLKPYKTCNNHQLLTEVNNDINNIFDDSVKDKVMHIPKDLGKGYFRHIMPTRDIAISISDVIFNKKTMLSESVNKDSISMVICVSNELTWKNLSTDTITTLKKGECCIYEKGLFEAENIYEKNIRYIGIGIDLKGKKFLSTINFFKKQKALSEFQNDNLEIYTLNKKIELLLNQLLMCDYIDDYKYMYIEAKVLETLSIFVNEIILNNIQETKLKEISVEDSMILSLIKKTIDERINEQIKIKELAQIAFISESNLRIKFKKHLGTTIHNYIIDKKMEKAKLIFDKYNYNVKSVAVELGYSNMSHFTDTFRSRYGLTPSEYINNK